MHDKLSVNYIELTLNMFFLSLMELYAKSMKLIDGFSIIHIGLLLKGNLQSDLFLIKGNYYQKNTESVAPLIHFSTRSSFYIKKLASKIEFSVPCYYIIYVI